MDIVPRSFFLTTTDNTSAPALGDSRMSSGSESRITGLKKQQQQQKRQMKNGIWLSGGPFTLSYSPAKLKHK